MEKLTTAIEDLIEEMNTLSNTVRSKISLEERERGDWEINELIWDIIKRPNLRMIRIEERQKLLKNPDTVFNKLKLQKD